MMDASVEILEKYGFAADEDSQAGSRLDAEGIQGARDSNPARLVVSLKAWKAKANGCLLVFPTVGCNPKLDFLACLKAAAERAELDKGGFWLHKFRATFATWHLWSGVDLRTVQQWLGHSDMESTMRYLKPSREAKTHDR